MPTSTLPLDGRGHMLLLREEANLVTVTDFSEFVGRPEFAELDALGLQVTGVASRCGMCGEWPRYEIAGDGVRTKEPCAYADGITTVTELAVPSGKIIVTDDLRPVYDWDDSEMADYNSRLGQSQAVKAMAEIGCAYGPVGNSCPGLYRTATPGEYIIARADRDEEGENPSIPDEDQIAWVCTDLWAYSIADYKHWKSRGGDPDALGWTDTVVDIPAGRYRFTYHGGERGFDRDADGTVIFTHVSRIGDVA